jgi:hypothetical protein
MYTKMKHTSLSVPKFFITLFPGVASPGLIVGPRRFLKEKKKCFKTS